eukprot:415532-Amphidinium_carterae.1
MFPTTRLLVRVHRCGWEGVGLKGAQVACLTIPGEWAGLCKIDKDGQPRKACAQNNTLSRVRVHLHAGQ